jgi:hypothetical protein
MNHFTIHTVIRNYSRFPIDKVWENAKDLEHVAFLHSNTNKEFHLLYNGKEKNSPFEYDILVYRARRKLFFLSFTAFGFRRIIQDHQINQVEYIPLLRITSALNSLLHPSDKPDFKTLMMDEIVMEIPKPLSWLKNYFIRALRRHTAIQCSEDEPFRERRVEIGKRKITLPFSLFNESAWTRLTNQFAENLNHAK